MAKSGVEYLAQHPGWKTRKRKHKGKGNKLSDTLRSAASALDHGRHSTAEKKLHEVVYRFSDGNTFTDNLTLAEARKFKKLQNGGSITLMPMSKPESVVLTLAELNALIDAADKALDGDSNDAEHDALYSLREQLAEFSTDPDRRRK